MSLKAMMEWQGCSFVRQYQHVCINVLPEWACPTPTISPSQRINSLTSIVNYISRDARPT